MFPSVLCLYYLCLCFIVNNMIVKLLKKSRRSWQSRLRDDVFRRRRMRYDFVEVPCPWKRFSAVHCFWMAAGLLMWSSGEPSVLFSGDYCLLPLDGLFPGKSWHEMWVSSQQYRKVYVISALVASQDREGFSEAGSLRLDIASFSGELCPSCQCPPLSRCHMKETHDWFKDHVLACMTLNSYMTLSSSIHKGLRGGHILQLWVTELLRAFFSSLKVSASEFSFWERAWSRTQTRVRNKFLPGLKSWC